MSAEIIDGRAVAAELREELGREIAQCRERGVVPGIATLLVGDDFGAAMYRDAVDRLCSGLGLHFRAENLPATAGMAEALAALDSLNRDPAVSGVLVLRPLAEQVDEGRVVERLAPIKDIDCLNPSNLGRLVVGGPAWPPATPAACLELLERRLRAEGREEAAGFAGEEVVVVGRSPSVGRPLAAMLLNRHATVTVCHSYTDRAGLLAEVTRRARYLVVAVGVPGFIGRDQVRPGAVVIDVGINQVFVCGACGAHNRSAAGACVGCSEDLAEATPKMVGDVRYDEVAEVVAAITPVPGGVGAVTNVMLARNAVRAAQMAADGARIQAE